MQSSNPYMGSPTRAAKGNAPHRTGGPDQDQSGYQDYARMSQGVQTAATTQAMPDAANYGRADSSDRPMTVDDVVAKTGITLAVLAVFAAVNFALGTSNPGLSSVLTLVGAIGGLIAVLVSSFGNKYGSATVTLVYAAFEGLFVGGISLMLSGWMVGDADAGALIGQAVLGTIGVFVGMLVVYRTGAIRVTPKFTRMLVGGMIGVLVLVLGNLVYGLVTGGAGPLRDGGVIAILFSLVCIALGAMSFLVDFDQADSLVRAGAPSKMAWGVALGLAVTLVWLYTEILRLLSYFRD